MIQYPQNIVSISVHESDWDSVHCGFGACMQYLLNKILLRKVTHLVKKKDEPVPVLE